MKLKVMIKPQSTAYEAFKERAKKVSEYDMFDFNRDPHNYAEETLLVTAKTEIIKSYFSCVRRFLS